MKIGIAGAGAMGCRFGALLSETNNEIILIDRWADHIEVINQSGLEVKSESGSKIYYLEASYPENTIGFVDLLIIFTKTMDTEAMINSCKHLIGNNTLLLTLQNGLGHIEILNNYVPKNRLIIGVTTYGTKLLGPGKIIAEGTGNVQAMLLNGSHSEELDSIIDLFNQSKIRTEKSDDVLHLIWKKLAFNCVLNTICTLQNQTVGSIGKYAKIDELISLIVDEIISVAHAEKIKLIKSEILIMIKNVFPESVAGNHIPSMVQDIENRRKTEIDFLNGAIVKIARDHGINVPVNLLIYHLIKMKEENQFVSEYLK
ncbi:ketopantoate reductase family protein [Alkalihalobacillus sp. 1P02AB]|uniref:ketopantoate reductase family protein n=1 Tax=Alkalihalobacillus sp. 1P02AB TaxID=3132260 RepID=UPI0039A4F878